MHVCASNQNGSFQDSPPLGSPQEVQFPCIVLEFLESYNEKCMSHYYYCSQSPQYCSYFKYSNVTHEVPDTVLPGVVSEG